MNLKLSFRDYFDQHPIGDDTVNSDNVSFWYFCIVSFVVKFLLKDRLYFYN